MFSYITVPVTGSERGTYIMTNIRKTHATEETRPTIPFPRGDGQFQGWGPRLGS